VAGRAEPVGCERVADLAQLVLGFAPAPVNHFGAEHLATETSVVVRLSPAQAVVDVESRDLVAQPP
jgi:hypothetical protein